ncbi:MAG: DUF2235 domain-containing protein [Polyangiaceae bacterium]
MIQRTPPQDQAALNDANASAFPEREPSAAQSCPLEKGIICGVFFDGTGNNRYDRSRAETNVSRLYVKYKKFTDDRYVRDKLYIIGPGAASGDETTEGGADTVPQGGWWHNIWGQAKGKGGKERLNIAYRWLKAKFGEHTATEHKMLDTYGFSRGASLSRTFVNLTNQALKREIENINVRFLGVFDTVGSWGGGEEAFENDGLDSGDALNWAHFTARHEHREHFPLTRLSGADKEYAGVHSDVGGGYADERPKVRNSLAFVTCNHMYLRSIESNVDMDVPPTNGVNIAELYRQSEEYCAPAIFDPNGAWAARRKLWFETYVHDSTGWAPWNWSTDDKIRVVLQHRKKHLGSPPPNFTWT